MEARTAGEQCLALWNLFVRHDSDVDPGQCVVYRCTGGSQGFGDRGGFFPFASLARVALVSMGYWPDLIGPVLLELSLPDKYQMSNLYRKIARVVDLGW